MSRHKTFPTRSVLAVICDRMLEDGGAVEASAIVQFLLPLSANAALQPLAARLLLHQFPALEEFCETLTSCEVDDIDQHVEAAEQKCGPVCRVRGLVKQEELSEVMRFVDEERRAAEKRAFSEAKTSHSSNVEALKRALQTEHDAKPKLVDWSKELVPEGRMLALALGVDANLQRLCASKLQLMVCYFLDDDGADHFQSVCAKAAAGETTIAADLYTMLGQLLKVLCPAAGPDEVPHLLDAIEQMAKAVPREALRKHCDLILAESGE